MPVISRKDNLPKWWQQNGNVFPGLQALALKYLSIVTMSVPSERLFSKAGELLSAKRNRLKPKNVNMFLFLIKYE